MITAEPDIVSVEMEEGDQFMILACDGIWDCMTNQVLGWVGGWVGRSASNGFGLPSEPPPPPPPPPPTANRPHSAPLQRPHSAPL